jgi:GAF domain-containing protein
VNSLKADLIRSAVNTVLERDDSPAGKLKAVCDLLQRNMVNYHWAGYYFVDKRSPSELVLGPFAGTPTSYTRIGFGQGICGRAASTCSVFVIDDVSIESNYLSCSSDVKSEFVAPVVWNGTLVGELDLDSRVPAAFRGDDIELLKWVADVTADTVAAASGFRFEEY